MKVDMTLDDAAAMLRKAAQTTAAMSNDWDNYEKICGSFLLDAMNAGREFGRQEAANDAGRNNITQS